jgi:hypothetical protein
VGGSTAIEVKVTGARDAGARRYRLVFKRANLAQRAYLKASNASAPDLFGCAVAVSGDTAVVGAVREDSGVGGGRPPTPVPDSGAAYVFVRNGDTWTQQAHLKASNPDTADFFGVSVAISGDTIVVGASLEDGGSAGVDGDPTDDSAPDAGAAYVFVRSGTTWTQQAYLKASNPDSNDHFGESVAISGNTIAVGAPAEDGSSSGVNGAQNDVLSGSGAAYVFVRTGTTWTQQAYVKASNPGELDLFGTSVGLSVNTLAVGAVVEDSSSPGVGGVQTDDTLDEAGAVYVFVRSGTTWTQQAYIKASNPGENDRFGETLALSGSTLVVGAPHEGSGSTGVNPPPNEDAVLAGAAYVFVRSGSTWSQQAFVKASNTQAGQTFGRTLALDGEDLAVSALGERSNATGLNGDQADVSAIDAGAVYLFRRTGTTWSQTDYVKASNTGTQDRFGFVGLSGGNLLVGAPGEASAATGIDGDQTDDSAYQTGAVYAFR